MKRRNALQRLLRKMLPAPEYRLTITRCKEEENGKKSVKKVDEWVFNWN